jgi:hypothetical protein
MENNLDLIAGKRVLELGAGLLQASCCCFPGRGRMPASRLLPNPVETDDTDPGEAIAQKRTQAPAPWSIGWGATVGVALAGCGLLGLCLARSGAPGSVTVSGFDGYPSSTCAGGERTAQSKKKSVIECLQGNVLANRHVLRGEVELQAATIDWEQPSKPLRWGAGPGHGARGAQPPCRVNQSSRT